MNAYVIKNKKGKYLSRYTNYDYRCSENDRKNICWTNNKTNIRLMSENGAKYTLKELNLEDCEIVEITITEGNLEVNQKAIECLKELKEKLKMHCDYYYTVDDADGWYLPETKIDLLIDNKIKELEKEK